MAKKLLIALVVIYFIMVIFVPFGETDNEKGRGLVLLTYASILAGGIIFRKTNGEGIAFKTAPLQNPITRNRIINIGSITAFISTIVGIILSIFVYKHFELSYMYDFVTAIVVLLVIWNGVKLIAGKIEQDLDPKLNNKPFKDRKNK
ncbi:hypothetical protein C7381_11010 [Ezakiella coagulans]|uniref:Uncharacterized protein n=1 Tax=Ezakiella coagulans TaxID=46507 RepID=A0A2U1DNP4_9FIRM|nr:hypothetical protein [Ezakiella coagulans]PVY89172.1 hypothetical protein C7381_11010 [Ezakiella coagulans]